MRWIVISTGLISISVLLIGCEPNNINIFGPFVVEQGSNSWSVSALSNGESVDDFFINNDNYGQTTTNVERRDVSELFLWDGPNGVSLIVIHDKHNDGSGGVVSFRITGLPTERGKWVVMDDFEATHDFDSETDTAPDWKWYPCCSDGGVFRGGLDGPFELTIHPAFNGEAERSSGGRIGEWQFLSGSATTPDRIELDMDQAVTIRRP